MGARPPGRRNRVRARRTSSRQAAAVKPTGSCDELVQQGLPDVPACKMSGQRLRSSLSKRQGDVLPAAREAAHHFVDAVHAQREKVVWLRIVPRKLTICPTAEDMCFGGAASTLPATFRMGPSSE